MRYIFAAFLVIALIALSFVADTPSRAYPPPGEYSTDTVTPSPLVSSTPLCGQGRQCTAEPSETQNAHLTETYAPYETLWAELTNEPTRTPRTPRPNQTEPPYPGPGDEYGMPEVFEIYLPLVNK